VHLKDLDGRIRFKDKRSEELKLIVTGDLCPINIAEKKLIDGRAEELFGNILPELLDKDISVTNLETVLTGADTPIVKCGPNLKISPDAIAGINTAGFDVYTLANNHTRDFGDDAFLETMEHIMKSGRKYVGGGRNLEAAAKPLRMEIKGLKISIINATMHNICVAGKNSPGANPLLPATIAVTITREKKDNDFVLVIIHDGKEHIPFPSARIRENYRAFADAGADAIIGHHPHIYQGFEVYKGAFIAYSLGNFLFPSRDPATAPDFWWKSYALRLHISANGVSGIDVIPHKLSQDGRMELMSGDERKNFLEKISGLNKIVSDDELCEQYYDAASLRFAYYEKKVSELIKLREAGDTAGEAHFKSVFYCHHMLTTEEHLDVLQSITKTYSSGKKLIIPDDLDYYMK